MSRAKGVGIALGVLVALAGLAAWWWSRPEPGPSYQGKSIAYWFHQYCLVANDPRFAEHMDDEVKAALTNMSTNALPFLVAQAMDTSEDSRLATAFHEFVDNLPQEWHLPPYLDHDSLREEAVDAIDDLKASAAVILPFVKPALESRSELQQAQAVEILGNVEAGKETLLPWFVKALGFSSVDARDTAVVWLDDLGAGAEPAVPGLIEILKQPETTNDLRVDAATVLGDIGDHARPALPLLTTLFDDEPVWWRRGRLATAIYQIDPDRTNFLGFLVEGLKQKADTYASYKGPGDTADIKFYSGDGVSVAASAAHQLGLLGPKALSAAPGLIQNVSSTNADVRKAAAGALSLIHAPAQDYVPILEANLLAAGDPTNRLDRAGEILDVDPGNPGAIALMVKQVEDGSEFAERAIVSLGAAGPAAKSALPALRKALDHSNPDVSQAAAEAIRNIEKDVKK